MLPYKRSRNNLTVRLAGRRWQVLMEAKWQGRTGTRQVRLMDLLQVRLAEHLPDRA